MAGKYLEHLIGAEKLAILAEEFGGDELKIPSTREAPSFKALVELVGVDAAEVLYVEYRGDKVYVPINCAHEYDKRYMEIRDLFLRGHSIAEIARTYTYQARLSVRHIQKIIKADAECAAHRQTVKKAS